MYASFRLELRCFAARPMLGALNVGIMKILERKRSSMGWVMVVMPLVAVLSGILAQIGVPAAANFLASLFMFGAVFVCLLTKGLQPAAKIKDNVLTIRGGLFSDSVIPRDKVESMYYIGGQKIKTKHGVIHRDVVVVKMVGFSEWEIPITDKIDHVDGKRLYSFIRNEFYDLAYKKYSG